MATNLSGLVKKLQDIMRSDPGINGDAQRIEQIIWALFLKVYDAKEEDWEMDEDEYHSVIPEKYRWQNWAHDDGKGTVRTGEELLDFVTELFTVLKNLPITPDMPKNKKIVWTMFEETNQYMKDGVLLRQVINVIDGIDLESYENMHALGDIYETILRELQSAGRAGEFYTPRAVTDFMAERIEPHLGEVMADFACGTGGFLVSWLRELEKQIKTPKDRELWNDSVYGIEKKQFPYMLAITNLLLHDIDNPNIDHGNSLLHDVLDYTEKDKFDKILMNPPYGGSEKKDVMSHFPDDLADSETADLFMSVILYRLKQGGRAAVVLPDGFLYIFPRDYCTKNGYDKLKWNSVVNKTPLSARSNREIGGNAPSAYLKRLEKKGSVSSADLDKYVESHWIDHNLLRADDFQNFIIDRAKKLLAAIEKATGRTISGKDSDEVKQAFGAALN